MRCGSDVAPCSFPAAGLQEQEGDEDEEAAEAEADAKEKKKKTLRPPGYKKPPLPKAKPKAAAAAAGDSQDGSGGEQGGGSGAKKRGGGKQRRSSVGSGDFTVGRRTVRDSTRLKVEEGELERKMAVKVGWYCRVLHGNARNRMIVQGTPSLLQ